MSGKKTLSTSDLDPFERKKQAALAKVEAKLEKAQRLYQRAQQSVEQEISDFLRATTIPNMNNEIISSRTANATFDKRIRTLQDTKKELEKKIANYHSDISRIQGGEIPYNYTSSKDILNNIKSTAVKVASGSLKCRPANNTEQAITASTPTTTEHVTSFQYLESDSHYDNPIVPITSVASSASPPHTITTTATTTTSGAMNNNQNLLPQGQHGKTCESAQSSITFSTLNEVGNSQFYIDSTCKFNRCNGDS